MKRWTNWLALALAMMMVLSGCAQAEAIVPAEEMELVPATAEALTEVLFDQTTWTEEPTMQDFNSTDLYGRAVNEEMFAGHKVTMINIWATYCNPCIAEMPDLALLNEAYEEGEFQVVGVVVDLLDQYGVSSDALETAWLIIEMTGADYTHLIPSYDLTMAKLIEVSAVPETIFVDSEGNILTPDTQYLGARSYDDWKTIIDGMLASME